MNILRNMLARTRDKLGIPSQHFPLRKGKRDFVFVHINKTGGTSISKAIGLGQKQHYTALESIDIVGQENWDNAFTFSFVRNPWSRVWSHYNYRVQTNQTGLQYSGLGFKDWLLKTYGEQDPHYYDQVKMFQPQLDWLCNDQGVVIIDFVGKFESLEMDFQHIAEVVGINKKLPHLNKSTQVKYREQYDEASKAIVEQWFAKDIAAFGYHF